MAAKKWVIKDLEDGERRIDDGLEVGFEADEGVASELSDASGVGVPSPRCRILDYLRNLYDGAKDTTVLCSVHGGVLMRPFEWRPSMRRCDLMTRCAHRDMRVKRSQYKQIH